MTPPIVDLWLTLTLESDATFGRGDGIAGVVDAEVQHDAYGLPYLGGKTLKGLLGAECAEVLFALEQTLGAGDALKPWRAAGQFLFGAAGSAYDTIGNLRVSDAQLPRDLCAQLLDEFSAFEDLPDDERERRWGLKRVENLESLTARRRQTALDAETGAPQKNTLRTLRVILRETTFVARLDFDPALGDGHARDLLGAVVSAFRRAGTGRNRGRGKLKAELYTQDPLDAHVPAQPVTADWLDKFAEEVRRASAHIPD